MRIAHLSDLHVLSRTGAQWRRIIFNKRLTGYANLILRRGRVHRREYLLAVLSAAVERADHPVITGDITNLSLEHEYEEARALLNEASRRTEVTVVPGNHDVYLPSTHRRFPHYFDRFLRGDLPQLARDLPAGRFPCVKLRGPIAIIALSSAVPRPPFIAAGCVGDAQLEAFETVLAHPEVQRRTSVVLIHHPPVDARPRIAQLRDGLADAEALRSSLARLPRGLVLFGHLHLRVRCGLPTGSGKLDVIGASGAALDLPSGIGDSLGMYRTTGKEASDPLALVEAGVSVLRAGSRPIILFDAEIETDRLSLMASAPWADPVGVRLRPTHSFALLRRKLSATGLPPRVIDASALLGEGDGSDVHDIADAVRLARTATRMRADGFRVAAIVYRGRHEPATHGFAALQPEHLATLDQKASAAAARASATSLVHSRMDPIIAAGGECYEFVVRRQPGWDPAIGNIRPHVHAKAMSADGRVCAVGSARCAAAKVLAS